MSVPNPFAAATNATGAQLDENFAAVAQLNAPNTLSNQLNYAPSVSLASAATVAIGAAASNNITITGAVTINAFDTIAEGALRYVTFTGVPTITYNVTSMQLINGVTRVAIAGGTSLFRSLGGGNWKEELSSMINIAQDLSGAPTFFAPITNSLGADVLLNNTANYFDGPSVAQGSVGKWFVSGTVVIGSTLVDLIRIKLWDGTTVVASSYAITQANLASPISITVSGFISAPAGNLRISAQDGGSANGKILFNSSGNSKDSTITAFRIG